MSIKSLTTGLAAAILAASVSAVSNEDGLSYNNNATGSGISDRVLIVNNCKYKVHLWSILQGLGCPSDEGATLHPGQFYHEQFRVDAKAQDVGVSIKISKTDSCSDVDITQLEYYQNFADEAYAFNFLDVSYVDCTGGDCPGRSDGYYLKAGNADTITVADTSNPNCPTFSCDSTDSCDLTSYVDPYDVQTKSCGLEDPLDFYLCGKDGSSDLGDSDETSSSAAASSEVASSTPTPSSSKSHSKSHSKSKEANVQAAEVTSAVAETTAAPNVDVKIPNVKTEVVYVTQYEYVNAKRHAHAHAHRQFHA